jgi:hypothetical protein
MALLLLGPACGRTRPGVPARRRTTPRLGQAVAHAQAPLVVQELLEEERLSGAGTTFQLGACRGADAGMIFGYADARVATGLRINGRLHHLTLADSRMLEPGAGQAGLGERRLECWTSPELQAVFDYRINAVGEDGTAFEGELTVWSEGRKAVFSISGGSGC